MKKWIAISVALAMMIGVLAVAPTSAADGVRKVYEADIIVLTTGDRVGEAWINEDGNIKVEIEGAKPLTTYIVKLMDTICQN